MATTITAQNGAVCAEHPVEAEGCANKMTVVSHSVKKRSITLKVAVPCAGKLTATGKGLSKATKPRRARGILTLTLKAKGSAKLNTKVKVSFSPAKARSSAQPSRRSSSGRERGFRDLRAVEVSAGRMTR